MKKTFRDGLTSAFVLSLFTTIALWIVGYDSICGFVIFCNRGFNPASVYGFSPFPMKVVGLYSGTDILYWNILLTYILFFAFYFGVRLIFIRLSE